MTALVDPAVADLQARVTALENALAQLGSNEALQPSYLTVDPAGNVGADFTGHIHAEGVDLGVDVNVFSSNNKVEWKTAAGVEAAEIGVQLNGADLRTLLRLLAIDTNGTGDQTALTLAATDAAGPGSVTALVDFAKAIIIDGTGASDFPQLAAGPALRAVDFGVTSVIWGGASTISGAVAVTHALGRAPMAVLPACRVRSDGGVSYAVYSGVTSSGFSLQAVASAAPAAGVNCNVSWLVIG